MNGKRYNVLMITVLTFNKQKNTHEWIYLDFMEEGTGSNQDFYFVRAVWMFLLGLSEIGVEYKTSSPDIDVRSFFRKKKIIFSDGAGQHFKQKKTISFWVYLQMQTDVLIEVHFFVSYHGHNVCDAHSAHMKLIILKKNPRNWLGPIPSHQPMCTNLVKPQKFLCLLSS